MRPCLDRRSFLGNHAPMGQTYVDPDPTRTEVPLDPWDGWVAERNQVLAEAQDRGVRNLVVRSAGWGGGGGVSSRRRGSSARPGSAGRTAR